MKFLGATFLMFIILRNEFKIYSDFVTKTNPDGNLFEQTFYGKKGSNDFNIFTNPMPFAGWLADLLIPKAILPSGKVKDLLN